MAARAKFIAAQPKWFRPQDKAKEADAYCRGWVTSALSKVSKLVFSESRKKAIAKYIDERSSRKNVGINQRSGSLESMQAGLEDGRDAELNRPVEGDEQLALKSGDES